ncbi:MAG: LuxR C-terminal-related transcriptional regulator [Gammaproteobacteria bacterium]|nr:LuxR C-terminal-related transcriptional regulator [Gammaproteobacteria bacterium]MBU1483055.1 LuxR C-terminal-related transcriptional regulator [Gammaproteobacteria bacterium]
MTNNLMIAGSCQDRLGSWKQELSDLVGTTTVIDSLGTLRDDVMQVKPKVLLLDYELLRSDDVVSLGQISAATKTIIIGCDISEEDEWLLLKAGVRGCCRCDVEPKLLRQVVMAVHQGELWIRRTLTCRLIDELGRATAKNKVYRESLGMLNKLTQREYDIAVRVGNGESNKVIAKACGITERTVKAHLTEVFIKLGVTDRLNLALVLSADERAAVRKSPGVPIMGKMDRNRSAIASYPGL